MEVRSTVSYSDLYGANNLKTGRPAIKPPTTGSNTSANTAINKAGSSPAMFWAGLIFLLILARFLIEKYG